MSRQIETPPAEVVDYQEPFDADKVPPLSFSTGNLFQQCPHQYYRLKVAKDVKDDFSHPVALWGKRAHKALEDFLLGVTKELPDEFRQFSHYAHRLKQMEGDRFVERKMAVDASLKPVDFFDNRRARYRSIVDYLVIKGDTAFQIDHKTGKVKPSDQLAMSALPIFAKYPRVQQIKGALYWLKHDTYTKYEYKREEAPAMESKLFRPVITAIRNAAETGYWPRQPSALCAYCPVKDCEYNR